MRRFDPRGRVNRALLVGVSRYDHTKPDESDGVPGHLPAVRDNVDRLGSVLRRGGVFREREITVCRSPSLDRFSEELRTAAHEAEGLLLCYFAGHGAVPSAGDELFLQMRNARVVAGGRAVFPGADAFTGVLTELAGSRAERVVVILDCCYAGNAAKIWQDFAHRQRILLLMSVQANRLIDSGGEKGPTPFTAGLVELLDVDGEVSLLRLFDGLRARMAASGLTTTLGDAWEPQHAGEPGTDVLLSARGEARRGNVPPGTSSPGSASPGVPGSASPGVPGSASPGVPGSASPGVPGSAGPGAPGSVGPGASGSGAASAAADPPPPPPPLPSASGEPSPPPHASAPDGGSGTPPAVDRVSVPPSAGEGTDGPPVHSEQPGTPAAPEPSGASRPSAPGQAPGEPESSLPPESTTARKSTTVPESTTLPESTTAPLSTTVPASSGASASSPEPESTAPPPSGPGPDPSASPSPSPSPSSARTQPAVPTSVPSPSGTGDAGGGPSPSGTGEAGGGPRPGTGSPGAVTALLGRLRALAGTVVKWAGSVVRLLGGRAAVVVAMVLTLAAVGLGSYAYLRLGDDHSCAPPLELRVLTDPDLEETVRAAADAYLTSGTNTTGHGCRRTGITVYSAGAAGAVGALRRQTGAWQEPLDEDADPQRDIGPQPDVWIPASTADVDRVVVDRSDRVFAELQPYPSPFVYSPIVLAVPQDLAGAGLDERVGRPLSRLVDDLRKRNGSAEVRRPDPELTGSALLATVGLYGPGTPDARSAEQRIRPAGPPAPTSAALLCALPEDPAADLRTAALVPEFLLKSGVGCARATREPRTAEYPTDVPALTPAFVRVRWEGGDRDAAARDEAVGRFHTWLTGEDGLAAFRRAGFRSATGAGHPLLDSENPGVGVLRNPSPLPGAAERTALDTALERYRSANGPGRVLYLLDSSGSMTAQWQGPSGGPGLLKHSLGGLGEQDEYGVWAVHGTSGDRRYDVLLPFDRHRRQDAERLVDGRARVHDAEADPHAALLAALTDMAGRGRDDERPQLIVYVTDDEDDNRLTGDNLRDVLGRAARAGVPVDMVSLVGGSCDQGRPGALIAEASGGRCLDAGDDLGTLLHDEVARVGTGED
ncbi:substrate-binding domain-containing protein [Streptomyces sp. NPDC046831]|uniref:substrate-binding domain-containing protein n=1 Tax=Streptomyces sp. NPDC046831 TaxID=3154805 RepID=UPI0033E595CD